MWASGSSPVHAGVDRLLGEAAGVEDGEERLRELAQLLARDGAPARWL